MDSVAVFIAKYFILIPVIAALYLIYKASDRRKLLIILVGSGVVSVILAKVASRLYWDPRPFVDGEVKSLFTASRDNGFPSDHTLLSSLVGFIALLYSRRLGYSLLIIAALIGWARVFSGVHHAVDIVASFVITGVSVFLVNQFLKTKYKKPAVKTPRKAS